MSTWRSCWGGRLSSVGRSRRRWRRRRSSTTSRRSSSKRTPRKSGSLITNSRGSSRRSKSAICPSWLSTTASTWPGKPLTMRAHRSTSAASAKITKTRWASSDLHLPHWCVLPCLIRLELLILLKTQSFGETSIDVLITPNLNCDPLTKSLPLLLSIS